MSANASSTRKPFWSVVAITCCHGKFHKLLHEEFKRLQTAGVLDAEIPVLLVEDPAPDLGSGSSTLNALLCAAERMCVQKGHTVLSEEVLTNGRVLIMHLGRNFLFEPCGKAFLSLPATISTVNGFELVLTTFIHNYNSITALAERFGEAGGVWVCGGDAFISISPHFWEDSSAVDVVRKEPILAFTFLASVHYAVKHGVYCVSPEGYLDDILFQAPLDVIAACAETAVKGSSDCRGRVPLVVALMHLSAEAAASFLGLHSVHPLNQCTYLGADSGTPELKLSLFFDFLLATCQRVSESDFVSGNRCGSYGLPLSISALARTESRDEFRSTAQAARRAVWQCFRKFRAKAVFLDVMHYHYFTNSPKELVEFYRRVSTVLSFHSEYSIIDENGMTYKQQPKETVELSEFDLNSESSDDEILDSGFADCGGGKSPFSAIAKASPTCCFHATPGHVSDFIHQSLNLKLSADQVRSANVFMPASDDLESPSGFEVLLRKVEAFGISESDFWCPGTNFLSWETARLHLLSEKSVSHDDQPCCQDLDWLFEAQEFDEVPQDAIKRWKDSSRLNLLDALNSIDLRKHFIDKLDLWSNWYLNKTKRVLFSDCHECLLPVFKSLCLYGFQQKLLQFLDTVVVDCGSYRVAGRTLACIADVLGIIAGEEGTLRSGPALHNDWQRALKMLEAGSTKEAVQALAAVRDKWMDCAMMTTRAARHYEAAAQVFIRKTIMSVKQFIKLQYPGDDEERIQIGTWCCVEAAARIDLAGGWSDTPPITYENGGAVVNAAVTVDGRKPITAKCRKINELQIVANFETASYERQTQVLSTLADVQCYNNPQAPASLLCACLVCAGIVDPNMNMSLRDQLLAKVGAGLEVVCKVNLPQGSGLGTSSILAGALLASLWRLQGFHFDTSTVHHAVLYVEQLLTTGGGWQDQVGGLEPGLKIGRFGNSPTTAQISVEHIEMNAEQMRFLNERLLLVYTGRTRLAKNLLQEVVRSWFARKKNIVDTVAALVDVAETCTSVLKSGCEPVAVQRLLNVLQNVGAIYAAWMAGAGGGGFLYLFTKKPNCKAYIEEILQTTEGCESMTVSRAEIDMKPLIIFCKNDDAEETN